MCKRLRKTRKGYSLLTVCAVKYMLKEDKNKLRQKGSLKIKDCYAQHWKDQPEAAIVYTCTDLRKCLSGEDQLTPFLAKTTWLFDHFKKTYNKSVFFFNSIVQHSNPVSTQH